MLIEKLGPINNAKIKLNRLNLFVGKNGTGKTVAAYAIYSFMNWFIHDYEAKFIDKDKIKRMIINNQTVEYNVDELFKEFDADAIQLFNNLPNGYFMSFFRGTGIFNIRDSHIQASSDDLRALLLPENERHGWYCEWSFVDNDDNEILSSANSATNRITSIYDSQTGKVQTFYSIHGATSAHISDESRARQYKSFLETSRQQNLEMLVNRGLKLVLFASSSAYLPAERIGINVFRSQLNTKRLANVQNSRADSQIKVYAKPIEDYITFVNNSLYAPKREKNGISIDTGLLNRLVPGTFNYDIQNDKVIYSLPDEGQIDFELLSSSLKSIFGLDLFLNHAGKNDWLFIDEPEMNLHPINQVYIAKLTYYLLTAGVRMVMSTHSDYMVKQLINCVLHGKIVGTDFSSQISVYNFSNNKIEKLDDLFEPNASIESFDSVTDSINNEYYELIDKIEGTDDSK